eukprot:CAMPEP_0168367468 /NCGR_PEP_ID=MMETSP0228-20121227/5756_1 /TAXON_ID=133427 /ORGANISM="Protoceratium reticulatum, Strain CCCM 535 (=CCMP 1889)" /LENGTH=107 /DNA_ID=CAMNT_0008380295 /DNA_START=699 /DNA_END=1020 /DNA_ORIENTATION=-
MNTAPATATRMPRDLRSVAASYPTATAMHEVKMAATAAKPQVPALRQLPGAEAGREAEDRASDPFPDQGEECRICAVHPELADDSGTTEEYLPTDERQVHHAGEFPH